MRFWRWIRESRHFDQSSIDQLPKKHYGKSKALEPTVRCERFAETRLFVYIVMHNDGEKPHYKGAHRFNDDSVNSAKI